MKPTNSLVKEHLERDKHAVSKTTISEEARPTILSLPAPLNVDFDSDCDTGTPRSMQMVPVNEALEESSAATPANVLSKISLISTPLSIKKTAVSALSAKSADSEVVKEQSMLSQSRDR